MLRLLALTVALTSACSGVEQLADVSYDDRFGSSTTMDVYMPAGGGEGRPAVLMIHGGGWRLFSKAAYAQQAERLAGAGFVAATINYRLVPDGAYPALMQDSHCALAFLRAHADEYGLDPDRVAVLGYSAGGHMASLLGVATDVEDFQPDCAAGSTGPPNGVISGAGPQDLRELHHADAIRELLGGTIDEVPERYDLASPLFHVGRTDDVPPYLLIHGSADLFVPIEQSEDMRDALRADGVDARLLNIPAGGHLLNADGRGDQHLSTSADTPQAWAAQVDFLDRTLGAP
jgi:acetyl esterase/lipase